MSRQVHRSIRAIAAVAVAASAIGSVSCSSMVRGSSSNSFLIIDRLVGIRGQSGDEDANLNSDVQAIVTQTIDGEEVRVPTIFEDGGLVTFRLALKDPGSPTVPNVATTNNFITVSRYRVEFIRSDGRNTQGVDVPHAFDGGVTATVRAEGTTQVSFTLVRIQAKVEAPLSALRGVGGAFAISTIAKVTFYGHDQTGRAVAVSGNLDVEFADWADEES